jgi:hypothetical protein
MLWHGDACRAEVGGLVFYFLMGEFPLLPNVSVAPISCLQVHVVSETVSTHLGQAETKCCNLKKTLS